MTSNQSPILLKMKDNASENSILWLFVSQYGEHYILTLLTIDQPILWDKVREDFYKMSKNWKLKNIKGLSQLPCREKTLMYKDK